MADNTTLDAGSGGDTIATDDIGGVKFPRSKIVIGADGTNDGDVSSANPLPISGTVDLGATDNAVLDSIVSALGGTLTVDGSGSTQPVSGTVTANLSATDNAVLDTIETNTDFGAVTGGGVEASALRVTIANDSTGLLSIDDGGGSLTVDGTVTANLGATDNAVLDAIQTAVEGTLTVDASGNAVPITDNSGSITVDAANDGSLNVVIGDGSNTATIRNLASNDALNVSIVDGSGNQVTSFGGSGGTSATDDSTFTAGSGSGTPVMGFFSTDTVDANDVGVLAMDASRRLLVSIEADNAGIGGGTQYTEDDAVPANPVGNALLAERDDALGGITPAEGDWTQLFVNASGALWVQHDGAITANLGATDNAVLDSIQAAVEVMDDWDESNRAAVNLISGQIGVDGGAGSVTSSTQRTTLADDDPAVVLLGTIDTDTGNISGSVATVAGAVSGSEMQVDVVGALPSGTNAIGKLAANSGVDIGDVDVTSIAAGSNLIGDVGIQGRTTGGLSIYYDNDIDETAVAVKASAGTLYSIHAINTTDAPLYLQFFNVAQGSVTVGTTTPTMQMIVPGNADSDGAGFTLTVPQGIGFSTAITLACSTNSEGNSAPGANACHVNLFYK